MEYKKYYTMWQALRLAMEKIDFSDDKRNPEYTRGFMDLAKGMPRIMDSVEKELKDE